jgi:ribonuclease R
MKHQNNSHPVEHTIGEIREAILQALTAAVPDLLKSNEISKAIGIKAIDQDYDLVREAIDQLEEEGLIYRTSRRRYGRTVPNVVIEGTLRNARNGRWLVVPADDPGEAFEIDQRNLWTAFHGDTVRAKMVGIPEPGENPQGEITRVIERANQTVVGTIKQGRHTYLDPDDRDIHRTITIRRKALNGARVGDKVVVKLYDWIDPYEDPEGSVIETLGRAGEMNAEIASIAAAHHLPLVFPRDVLAEADAFPAQFTEEDLRDRRDLRDMAIMTIDPYDARDFDDAISIEEHEGGDVTLGIHIADVGHYVREGSALDREAQKRGTSVYLVTGVIPMLPERLSNDLCSLRPHEDRLAYSVFVRLSPRGAVRDYEITKSIINSKRRFTYEEALEVLRTGEGDYARELLAINRIAHVLRENRRRKGSVDFDKVELKFRLDERNHPVEVVQKRATESTRLIEDCMLLANRVVAEHIGKGTKGKSAARGGNRNPFIYRIHDVPPKEKILDLNNFLKTLGLSIPTDNVGPKDIQRLIDQVKGTDKEEMVTEMTLRSMAKAVYSEFNIGHFGLAYTYYTHFTSPIRRYPDLIVHRLLLEYAHGMSGDRRAYLAKALGPIADHCSERERAAVEAERDSVKIAGVEFLKEHVGDSYEATISGVMRFGIFAAIKDLGIEGLVRVGSMRDDFYIFDERGKTFRGQRSKKVFHLGDTIHVRVIRVDEIEGQIDMELIEEAEFLADEGSDGAHLHTHRSGRSGRSAPAASKKGRKERGAATKREAKAGSSRKKKAEPVAEAPRKGRRKQG